VKRESELWTFIADRLDRGENVMLLVVAESSGSSPGCAGYKMAVGADGELCGSIGGGVMEVNLVEQSRKLMSELDAPATGLLTPQIIEQVHQKNSPNSSGMICSGKQTVIFNQLTSSDSDTVNSILECRDEPKPTAFEISNLKFQIVENTSDSSPHYFSRTNEKDFVYQEKLGSANELYIIGGGHCALALSELMSRLDFQIRILDDRPKLNTIAKNEFADEVTIVESYDQIGQYLGSGAQTYVVVMTLGYAFDEIVVRTLIDKEFKYFGVLGSRAKMAVLLKTLEKEGVPAERLARIHTPIGVPINSHTPEEIAVSIAAEIISIKNAPS
jgi:xanthine dehydrogenase accessory factor